MSSNGLWCSFFWMQQKGLWCSLVQVGKSGSEYGLLQGWEIRCWDGPSNWQGAWIQALLIGCDRTLFMALWNVQEFGEPCGMEDRACVHLSQQFAVVAGQLCLEVGVATTFSCQNLAGSWVALRDFDAEFQAVASKWNTKRNSKHIFHSLHQFSLARICKSLRWTVSHVVRFERPCVRRDK